MYFAVAEIAPAEPISYAPRSHFGIANADVCVNGCQNTLREQLRNYGKSHTARQKRAKRFFNIIS